MYLSFGYRVFIKIVTPIYSSLIKSFVRVAIKTFIDWSNIFTSNVDDRSRVVHHIFISIRLLTKFTDVKPFFLGGGGSVKVEMTFFSPNFKTQLVYNQLFASFLTYTNDDHDYHDNSIALLNWNTFCLNSKTNITVISK